MRLLPISSLETIAPEPGTVGAFYGCVRRVLTAGCFLLCAGCVTLPPDVEKELSAPDGQRPNNFELVSDRIDKADD